MNKNLLKRIASVATELDQFGFTREAKSLDAIFMKLANESFYVPRNKGIKQVIELFEKLGYDKYTKKLTENLNFINQEPSVYEDTIDFMGINFEDPLDFVDFVSDEYKKLRGAGKKPGMPKLPPFFGPEKPKERPVEIDEDKFDEADMFPFMGESGYPDGSEYGNQEFREDIDYF